MDSSVRVLHTGGFRFDSPSWAGPATWATVRNQDLWQTFEAVLTLCKTEHIDFLFLAGDLFEQDYVSKGTIERVAKSLGSLVDTKVFITPGEKDPLVSTSAYRLVVWPGNVHIFSGNISRVEIPARNSVVYGAGWTAYRQDRPFLEGFQAKKDGRLQLMLLHAEVDPWQTEGFIPLMPGQIASSGLTFLALGHQESWSGVQQAGETYWADCGSPEARSFSERGPHGVLLGEIASGSARFEFRELAQRRYIEKTLSLPSGNLEALVAKLLADTGIKERQRDLFRVTLTGPLAEAEKVASVQTLQKLLADKIRYFEVLPCESDEAVEYGSVALTPKLKPGADNRSIAETRESGTFRKGFPTMAQVFTAKIQAHLAANVSVEEKAHWELVQKIGLTALGQGRIDDEN